MVAASTRLLVLVAAFGLTACPTIRRGPLATDSRTDDGAADASSVDAFDAADAFVAFDARSANDVEVVDQGRADGGVDVLSFDASAADVALDTAQDRGIDTNAPDVRTDSQSSSDSQAYDADSAQGMDGAPPAADASIADAVVDARESGANDAGTTGFSCVGYSRPGCICRVVEPYGTFIACTPYVVGSPANNVETMDDAVARCQMGANGVGPISTLMFPRDSSESVSVAAMVYANITNGSLQTGAFGHYEQRMWMGVRNVNPSTASVWPDRPRTWQDIAGLQIATTGTSAGPSVSTSCFGGPAAACPWEANRPGVNYNDNCLEALIRYENSTASHGGVWNDVSCSAGPEYLWKYLVCRVP